MRLPIRPLGLVAAGLLLGTALAPVAAQQSQSGVDGQVAVRSDGAVYLISNGQRRWVATVVISDDEINGYPEGEPIFVGLAPLGSSGASTAASNPQPKPSGATSPTPASGSSAATKPSAAAPPTSTPDPNTSTDIPVEVDIDGSSKLEAGAKRRVDIKTRKDATCELVVKLPGGKELTEDSKNADNSGKCVYNIEIPSDTPDGDGVMIGSAREGGKVNKHELPFSVIKDKD